MKRVADLMAHAATSSWQIADNKTTSVEQKKAAMADLSAQIRNQVTAQLGPARAENYLNSTRWFSGIATGTAVQLNDRMIAMRSVDTPGRMTMSASATTASPGPSGVTTTTTTTQSATVPVTPPRN